MTFPDGYLYTFLLSARGATIWSIRSLRSKGPSCYPLEAPLFRVFIHYGDFSTRGTTCSRSGSNTVSIEGCQSCLYRILLQRVTFFSTFYCIIYRITLGSFHILGRFCCVVLHFLKGSTYARGLWVYQYQRQ